MIKVDLNVLYKIGALVSPLTKLSGAQSSLSVLGPVFLAHQELAEMLMSNFFSLKTSRRSGEALQKVLSEMTKKCLEGPCESRCEQIIEAYAVKRVAEAAKEFEITLKAELNTAPCYLVISKGGYDIDVLMREPWRMFPEGLVKFVPESLYDVSEAGKCLAFEIPSAAAFHLHRINEAVLHRYWDVVSDGESIPKKSSMGLYINKLEEGKKGDIKVIASLKQIKDLHRNPTIHPGDKLTVQEAIELFGIIVSVVSMMLCKIREPGKKLLA